jgi:hypothetical protein
VLECHREPDADHGLAGISDRDRDSGVYADRIARRAVPPARARASALIRHRVVAA